MPKLYLKVGRVSPRTFSWTSPNAGAVGIDKHRYRMSEAEAGEFSFIEGHPGKNSTLGAGGAYEYRVYETLGDPMWPYAIVLPWSTAVREQYPDACRLVDMSTGRESALYDNREGALNVAALAKAGKLKGSF